MILIKKLILLLIKVFILFVVVTFEKVVGLPVISITLLLVFFTNERSIYKLTYLVSTSIFLALTYDFSFSLSLLFLACLVLGIKYGNNIITHDINRVLFLIFTLVGVIAVVSKITLGGVMIGYFVISSLTMIIILMKTLFSRRGLTDKIVNEKSNFFR